MKVTRQIMQLMLDQAQQAGHPDPLSLLARMSVDTQFEVNFDDGKGKTGFAGVDSRTARRLGINDFTQPEPAIDAAVRIDVENYDKVGGSIDKMLIAWRKGARIAKSRKTPLHSEKRWLGKIKSARADISRMLGLSAPETEIKKETAADVELRDAFTSKAFVVEKRVKQEDLLSVFFPEADREDSGGQALIANPELEPVEVNHKERMISMLIEMIEVA